MLRICCNWRFWDPDLLCKSYENLKHGCAIKRVNSLQVESHLASRDFMLSTLNIRLAHPLYRRYELATTDASWSRFTVQKLWTSKAWLYNRKSQLPPHHSLLIQVDPSSKFSPRPFFIICFLHCCFNSAWIYPDRTHGLVLIGSIWFRYNISAYTRP